MGYNARNDEIRDNITRMKHNVVRWLPCAASTQRFLQRAMFGFGPRLQPR